MRIIVTTLAALFIAGSAFAGPVSTGEATTDTSVRTIEANYGQCGCGRGPKPSY